MDNKKEKNSHNHTITNKLSHGRSIDVPNETHFMDQLTIAATQSGHRLTAYLMRLLSAFHRDMRSTCDTFELLMHHYNNDDFGDEKEDGNVSVGKAGPVMGNAGYSHTHKSEAKSQRLLENLDKLARLHEYLVVVRLLLVQTGASLLTTMDNIVIIKASADAYQRNKNEKQRKGRSAY